MAINEILEICFLSLGVSCSAVFCSYFIGLGVSFLLYSYEFRLKKAFIILINSLMGLPPVVVGLVVSYLLYKEGALGFLNLLYTPFAMVIAQTILISPIITSFFLAGLESLPKEFKLKLLSFSANKIQVFYYSFLEIKKYVITGILAGFGRAFSEVGAVLIVGGDIENLTRVLTTAIVVCCRTGEFIVALILGGILLSISFAVSLWLHLYKK